MASTFGGLTFYTERNGTRLPEVEAEAEIATQHVPGSNINIVDIGGLRESRIARPIVVARADVTAWLNARCTMAELIVLGVSKGPALLANLSGHEAEANDAYDAFVAEWILTA